MNAIISNIKLFFFPKEDNEHIDETKNNEAENEKTEKNKNIIKKTTIADEKTLSEIFEEIIE